MNKKITVRELLELNANDDRCYNISLYDEEQQLNEEINVLALLKADTDRLRAWCEAEVEYWHQLDADYLELKVKLLKKIPTRTVMVNITDITTRLVEVAVPDELDEQAAADWARRDVETDYCNGKIDMTVAVDSIVEYDVVDNRKQLK